MVAYVVSAVDWTAAVSVLPVVSIVVSSGVTGTATSKIEDTGINKINSLKLFSSEMLLSPMLYYENM